MTIDAFALDDIQELFDVFCEWDFLTEFSYKDFSDSLAYIQNEPFNQIFVAKNNGKIVGYVQVFREVELGLPVKFEVSELIVSKTERSKGTGTLLLQKAESYAKENGATSVELSSQLYRSRAHVFYESNGYTCNRMSKFYSKLL